MMEDIIGSFIMKLDTEEKVVYLDIEDSLSELYKTIIIMIIIINTKILEFNKFYKGYIIFKNLCVTYIQVYEIRSKMHVTSQLYRNGLSPKIYAAFTVGKLREKSYHNPSNFSHTTTEYTFPAGTTIDF